MASLCKISVLAAGAVVAVGANAVDGTIYVADNIVTADL